MQEDEHCTLCSWHRTLVQQFLESNLEKNTVIP